MSDKLAMLTSPGTTKPLAIDGHWAGVSEGNPFLHALHKRHYSCSNHQPAQLRFGPGHSMCLLTVDCMAGFVWLKNTHYATDQRGLYCCFFRNEGPILSSELILEAEELAWQRWPRQRLFTYVWPEKLRQPSQKYRNSKEPGRCFIKAGWKIQGPNKTGHLTILYKLPPGRVFQLVSW